MAADVDKDGRGWWQCVKQLQIVYGGHQSVRTSTMQDKHGHLFSDPDAVTRVESGSDDPEILGRMTQGIWVG